MSNHFLMMVVSGYRLFVTRTFRDKTFRDKMGAPTYIL